MKTITRDEQGHFVRDDTALREGMIRILDIIKMVATAWELFPDLKPEARTNFMDAVYRELTFLKEDLKEVDAPKGDDDGNE